MRLKKWVQGVLGFMFVLSLSVIVMTIDSEWTMGVVWHLIANTLMALGSGSLLVMYGRWE